MSALGVSDDQLIEVYRGLARVEPGGVNLSELGRHWTTSYSVARSFTDSGEPGTCGALIRALVRRDDVITEADPEYEELRLAGTEAPDSPEREVPLHRWADVWVTSITYVWDDAEEHHTLSGRSQLGAA